MEMMELTRVAINSSNDHLKKHLINTLVVYGEKAIPYISQIIEIVPNDGVRIYGSNKIRMLKTETGKTE